MGTYGLLAFQYYLVTFISPEDGRHYVNRAERLASVNYHDCFASVSYLLRVSL